MLNPDDTAFVRMPNGWAFRPPNGATILIVDPHPVGVMLDDTKRAAEQAEQRSATTLADRMLATNAMRLVGSARDIFSASIRLAFRRGWRAREAYMAVEETMTLHPDELAVRAFAERMVAKMAASRAKGRSGWQGMPVDELWAMLRAHVEKGDPVDVANFAMMVAMCNQAAAQRRGAAATGGPRP